MSTYLFVWNPVRWNWPDFQKVVATVSAGEPYEDTWGSGNRKTIRPEDLFYFVRVGEKPTGIIGSGVVVSQMFRLPNWDNKPGDYNANLLLFAHLLDPSTTPILATGQLLHLKPGKYWSPQSSGVIVPDEIVPQVDELWRQTLALSGRTPFTPTTGRVSAETLWPELDDATVSLTTEGRARLVTHLRRERNPALVKAKKEQVVRATGRLACEACEFDFFAVYGERGEGFAECHHTNPLSDGEQRTLLPDLAIVCANCHRIIHRRLPLITVGELRSALTATI